MEPLSPDELRVLGVLVEKQATTPDQYPLTMAGLLAGVNQTSNRNPVLHWSPEQAAEVVDALRARKLVRVVHASSGSRAERFRQVLGEEWGLGPGELAVLAVLALRGPQTVNELVTRTERYAGLDDFGGVEGVLHRLKNRYDEPYVTRLERAPGQREERWAHLLAGEVITVDAPARPGAAAGVADRVAALEAEVAALRSEVAELRQAVAHLSAQTR